MIGSLTSLVVIYSLRGFEKYIYLYALASSVGFISTVVLSFAKIESKFVKMEEELRIKSVNVIRNVILGNHRFNLDSAPDRRFRCRRWFCNARQLYPNDNVHTFSPVLVQQRLRVLQICHNLCKLDTSSDIFLKQPHNSCIFGFDLLFYI